MLWGARSTSRPRRRRPSRARSPSARRSRSFAMPSTTATTPSLTSRVWAWVVRHFDKLFNGTPQGTSTLVVLVLVAAVLDLRDRPGRAADAHGAHPGRGRRPAASAGGRGPPQARRGARGSGPTCRGVARVAAGRGPDDRGPWRPRPAPGTDRRRDRTRGGAAAAGRCGRPEDARPPRSTRCGSAADQRPTPTSPPPATRPTRCCTPARAAPATTTAGGYALPG